MNQLEIRSSRTNRAEIFTRGVSLQDHSSLKFSAQKTHPKWEIISVGGGPLIILTIHNRVRCLVRLVLLIHVVLILCVVHLLLVILVLLLLHLLLLVFHKALQPINLIHQFLLFHHNLFFLILHPCLLQLFYHLLSIMIFLLHLNAIFFIFLI